MNTGLSKILNIYFVLSAIAALQFQSTIETVLFVAELIRVLFSFGLTGRPSWQNNVPKDTFSIAQFDLQMKCRMMLPCHGESGRSTFSF